MEKICTKCKIEYPETLEYFFYRKDHQKFHNVCKKCWKKTSPIENKKYYNEHLLYFTWKNMMTRCYSEKHNSYKNYGGRGIKVCDIWHNFDNFEKDILENLGEKEKGVLFDRIDNNLNYQPGNVKWSSYKESNNNKRDRHDALKINYNGENITLLEASFKSGIKYHTLKYRFHNNLPLFDKIEEKLYEYNGEMLNLYQIHLKTGINYSTLSKRAVNNKNLYTPIEGSKLYEYKGEMKTLREIETLSGINYETLRGRVKKGVNILSDEIRNLGEISLLEYNGEMLKLSEIAKKSGIKYHTLLWRYRNGRPLVS